MHCKREKRGEKGEKKNQSAQQPYIREITQEGKPSFQAPRILDQRSSQSQVYIKRKQHSVSLLDLSVMFCPQSQSNQKSYLKKKKKKISYPFKIRSSLCINMQNELSIDQATNVLPHILIFTSIYEYFKTLMCTWPFGF